MVPPSELGPPVTEGQAPVSDLPIPLTCRGRRGLYCWIQLLSPVLRLGRLFRRFQSWSRSANSSRFNYQKHLARQSTKGLLLLSV